MRVVDAPKSARTLPRRVHAMTDTTHALSFPLLQRKRPTKAKPDFDQPHDLKNSHVAFEIPSASACTYQMLESVVSTTVHGSVQILNVEGEPPVTYATVDTAHSVADNDRQIHPFAMESKYDEVDSPPKALAIDPRRQSNRYIRWGIDYNGTCFPVSNSYIGAYLCDPDNKNPKCAVPRKEGVADTNQMDKFNHQMDAISVNWDIGHDVYTITYIYQANCYVRWSLSGAPLFEIPASALTSPPQNANNDNPKKLMIEEPKYLIFNVALAKAWGATPPNKDIGPCRGNATSNGPPGTYEYNTTMSICDSFPM
ncbi:Aste57867_10503 [Aphanomyces stellatus]|uniref:Aste57867_10503 protein n=1 Tax=Aphanomyces stellatus TaxID=120398 RepID=A0A485KQM3_9STRA|nr:hypothetical protein As57867_010463 [Aphanomyces stellatus]VFT87376.1 Aste57867_10503 [Aphanomyces stellatus]